MCTNQKPKIRETKFSPASPFKFHINNKLIMLTLIMLLKEEEKPFSRS